MKKNMGATDKLIRIILAVLVAVLYYTSFISFCPLYLPFGISTVEKKD